MNSTTHKNVVQRPRPPAHRRRGEWREMKRYVTDFGKGGVRPPTTELVSVEECSKPDIGSLLRFATTRLVRVESAYGGLPGRLPGNIAHGDELRGGVGTSLRTLW